MNSADQEDESLRTLEKEQPESFCVLPTSCEAKNEVHKSDQSDFKLKLDSGSEHADSDSVFACAPRGAVFSPQACLDEPPLFIEACCGSAILSSVVSKMGFEVLPIDFHGNKHRPHVHVVELDLRKSSTWEYLDYLVSVRKPFSFIVHLHAELPRKQESVRFLLKNMVRRSSAPQNII